MRRATLIAHAVIFVFFCASAFSQALEVLDRDGTDRNRRVVKILRSTNKAQVNQFVPVAFEFENVNPYAVARFIRRPIEAEEGNWFTFVHPDGEKGVVLLNIPIWMVEPMTELMALIDRPQLTTSSGSERSYYRLKHRDPTDSGFRAAIAANLTGTGDLLPDAATGALFLEDAPSGLQAAVSKLEREIDVPTAQVMVRMKVYEVDISNDGTIGLDYTAWKNGPGRNLFAAGYFNEYFKTSRLGVNGGLEGNTDTLFRSGADEFGLPSRRIQADGYNVAYFYDVPSAYFDYLVTKGKARIVTAPRATVMNTETAAFSTGEEILFYRVQNGPSDLAGVRPPGLPLDPNGDNINFPDNRTVSGDLTARVVPEIAEAGVELQVTPVIGEQHITLDVDISIVSQLGFDDSGIPTLHTRQVNSTIRAQPSAEYILGGMTRTRALQTTQKVPILGSIPILGYLFGGETTVAKKSLVVVVLSAEPVENYSGMGFEEQATINAVETKGMSHVPMPDNQIGIEASNEN